MKCPGYAGVGGGGDELEVRDNPRESLKRMSYSANFFHVVKGVG